MSWILPTKAEVMPVLRAMLPKKRVRRRPGYWRDHYREHRDTRRPYIAAKMREYRAARRAA